jgi:predicted pyridoxine 5'-phosphate oxidase superfamily flavin-nucleotide-binding protein
MARRFTELAFTESVRAAQERYGSRAAVHGLERASDARDRLGEAEAAFIAARDGFYMASVGENGWPYVQFRGGPAGFLRVLDERTLGYADFRGNRQYISAGNLQVDGRAALILMDYAAPRRLKIWARARIVDAVEDPALAERLAVPGYPGRVERAMLLAVEAFDWNCPQHITPRFTEAEVLQAVAPLRHRVDELEAEVARLRAGTAAAS